MTPDSENKSVSMMVRCLGNECINCPQLDIEINWYYLYGDGDGDAVNILSCKNLPRCLRIKKHLRKNSNSDNEKDGV